MTAKLATIEDINQIFEELKVKYGTDTAIGLIVRSTTPEDINNSTSATQLLYEKMLKLQDKE